MGYLTPLKNGSAIDSQRIKTFYDCWLKPLFNQEPDLVALLYFYAIDDSFEIEAEKKAWFIKLAFLQDDGTLDPDFRNVILSAVTIDPQESNLIIERPEMAKEPPPPRRTGTGTQRIA